MEELQEVMEEKTVDLSLAKRHFTKFGLVFLFGSIFYMGFQYVGAIFGALVFPDLVNDMNSLMIAQMAPAYLIGVPLFLLLLKKVPKTGLERNKVKKSTLISLFPMIYAVTILSNMVGLVINSFISELTQHEVTNLVSDLLEETNPLLVFVMTVIMAPLVEETLFRKALISRTVKYGEGVAIFLSGIMFALIHGNLNQIPYAFSIGCVLGYIYVRTGDLRITIALHAFTNLMGGVVAQTATTAIDLAEMERVFGSGTEEQILLFATENAGGLLIFALYTIVAAALIISGTIIFIIQARKVHLKPTEQQLPKRKRFSTVVMNPGMILFFAAGIAFIFLQS